MKSPRVNSLLADSPFAALGLSAALVRAAGERGYAVPTPIQAAAIPLALQGRDLVACAHTGSGKTAAFGLALLNHLELVMRPAWRRTRALVLVPTRELAAQVGETVRALSRHLTDPVKVAILFGGVSINPQMLGLRVGKACSSRPRSRPPSRRWRTRCCATPCVWTWQPRQAPACPPSSNTWWRWTQRSALHCCAT